MKRLIILLNLLFLTQIAWSQDFAISEVKVTKDNVLSQLVFSIEVEGLAGDSTPTPNGALDGAPVLGYVFPTTLKSTDVGFDSVSGIVALALTSHPDFDDTPLWDENMDADYKNDGIVWHPHWVVLESNEAVPGGLAVKATTVESVLPPTNPGMPMYMDSPGFPVVWSGNTITCTIPLYRINYQDDFKYDGVSAFMKVNTSKPELPMLGVYEALSVASGNLSLPYSVGNYTCDTLTVDISNASGPGLIDPEWISVYPNPAGEVLHLTASAGFDLSRYKVEVRNMNSSLIMEQNLTDHNSSIQTSSIGSAGKYLLNVVDRNTGERKGSKIIILTN